MKHMQKCDKKAFAVSFNLVSIFIFALLTVFKVTNSKTQQNILENWIINSIFLANNYKQTTLFMVDGKFLLGWASLIFDSVLYWWLVFIKQSTDRTSSWSRPPRRCIYNGAASSSKPSEVWTNQNYHFDWLVSVTKKSRCFEKTDFEHGGLK